MTITIPEDLDLKVGAHDNYTDGACLLEAASYLAGEKFSDHPACVSPVIGAYGRSLNDSLPDLDRQRLKQFLPAMLSTARDGFDTARVWILTDWAVRVATPRLLDAAGLTEEADALRRLSPVTDESTAREARTAARAVRETTWPARVAWRASLRQKVQEELKKRGAAAAVAAVAAAADAAVAAAAADAAAVAVAAAAADAAVGVADAAAVAVAAAADAAAAAAAAAVPSYGSVYTAVRKELEKRLADGTLWPGLASVIRENRADAIALLGRISTLTS